MKIDIKLPTGLFGIYWLFAVAMSFMADGFWCGMLNIIFPISPMIHLVNYLITTGAL